jgi:4-hydroxybenzoate polyprenyltransferase
MLILPLIDLYVTACDWWTSGRIPTGLLWLLLVTFLNGIVIEVGRKLRAPADEEHGVETYSRLWGRPRAVTVWLAAMSATGFCARQAAKIVTFDSTVLVLLALLLSIAAVTATQFLRNCAAGSGKRIETMSGIWSLLMYLSIGLLPLAWRTLRL